MDTTNEFGLTEQELKWKKKFYPRVPWGPEGPVRRVYLVQSLREDIPDAGQALAALAGEYGFCGTAVIGDAAACRDAFAQRAAENRHGESMIFGTELAAVWCDAAVFDEPGEPGWQRLIVRSEEAENLTALSHEESVLKFRKAE